MGPEPLRVGLIVFSSINQIVSPRNWGLFFYLNNINKKKIKAFKSKKFTRALTCAPASRVAWWPPRG